MKHMIIQVILITMISLTLFFSVRKRGSSGFQASEKVHFVSFLVVSVLAVIMPDRLSGIARMVGVGRGADLLLYLLILAFVFVVQNSYLKFKDLEKKITELARQVSLNEAMKADRIGACGLPQVTGGPRDR